MLAYTRPPQGTFFDLEIRRDGDLHELFIDSVLQSTASSNKTSTAPLLDVISRGSSTESPLDIEYLSLYDAPTGGSLIVNWDATASSHAAGTPVLVDTTGGNNATGVNMPTDGSAWLDLGGGLSILPTDISSGELFGSPTLSAGGVLVSPTPITTEEQFGSLAVSQGAILVQPAGISTEENLGTPAISVGGVLLSPNSINTQEVIGSPSLLAGSVVLSPTGIASLESLGDANLSFDQVLQLISIDTGELFGVAIIQDGIALVIPSDSRATYQKMQEFLASTGKFVSNQNNDIILEWLKSEGVQGEQFNDLFSQYWEDLGYTGAYNDKWSKWKNS